MLVKQFIFNEIYWKMIDFCFEQRLILNKSLFKKVRPTLKDTEIHSRTSTLSSTLFCDTFVKLAVIFAILFYKIAIYQKLFKQ